MKPERSKSSTAAVVIALVVIAAFSLGGKNAETPPPQKSLRTSGYTVNISEEAQKTGGIATAPLKPGLYQVRTIAYGRVLSAGSLNASRRRYIDALAGLEKAEALLKASSREYERLKTLNADSKNVSDKVLQTAAAGLASDRADEARFRSALQSTKDEITLQWGPVLSEWVFDYSAPLLRLFQAKDVLVKVSVPPAGRMRTASEEIVIEPPVGGSVSARLVSPSTSTDPKLQGMSFLYIAPSGAGRLLPGMNVTARMSATGTRKGFLVPLSAVVWLQDRAWVYIMKTQTGFSRVEVPTAITVNGDYFVPGVFSAGDRLVVEGAQALLSAETAPKAGGGGEEDED